MKKGFTLTEILAVIVLLGIVITLAVPAVNKITSQAKANELKDKINLIETSAVFYAQKEVNTYPTDVTIDTLIANDYLKADVANGVGNCSNSNGCMINPLNNSVLNNEVTLSKDLNGKITATYNEN